MRRPPIDPKEKSALARIRYHQTEADYYGAHDQPKMQRWASEEATRWTVKLEAILDKRRKS